MNLTAGATLQDGKYIVQATLDLTELGVTLQATHVYLDQTVILQTLNPSLRDRRNFANLRQQFITTIKQLGKRDRALPSKIVDCFEEDGMPFLVLERIPDQPVPKVEDWFIPAASSEVKLPIITPTSEATPSSTTAPILLPPLATNGAVPQPTADVTAAIPNGTIIQTQTVLQTNTQPAEKQNLHPLKHLQTAAVPTPPPSPSRSKHSWQAWARSQSKSRKSKRWIPFALMVTAAVAALGGASFGLSLRLGQPASSPSPSNTESETDGSVSNPSPATAAPTMPPVGEGLFGSDQSFPALDNWPGTSIIDSDKILPPDDMPIERAPAHSPVRRERSVGDYEPPPAERLPEAPSDAPVIQEPPSEDPSLAEEVPPFEPLPAPDMAPVPEPVEPPVPSPSTLDLDQLKPIPPASSEPSLPTENSSSPKNPPPASAPSPAAVTPIPDVGPVN